MCEIKDSEGGTRAMLHIPIYFKNTCSTLFSSLLLHINYTYIQRTECV